MLPRHGRVDRRRAAASCSTAACSTGLTGNAGHIGHVIVVPEGGRRCGCGAHGCLEAEASGIAIEAVTGRPPAEAPLAVRHRRRVCSPGRAVASVAALLDLRLAVVAGSVALGYGDDRSSRPPRPSSIAAVASSTPRAPSSARLGSAPTARCSAPPPSPSTPPGHLTPRRRRPAVPERRDPRQIAEGEWRIAFAAMQPTYTPEAEAFREKIQAFLAEHLPAGWTGHRRPRRRRASTSSPSSGARPSTSTASWPSAGRRSTAAAGLSPLEQVIVAEEFTKAGVPAGRRQRRLRHPDARQHAAHVGHRGAEAALPAAHPRP